MRRLERSRKSAPGTAGPADNLCSLPLAESPVADIMAARLATPALAHPSSALVDLPGTLSEGTDVIRPLATAA
jgi:hypothetical protein